MSIWWSLYYQKPCFDMKDARMDLIIWLIVHVIIDQKHWKQRLKNVWFLGLSYAEVGPERHTHTHTHQGCLTICEPQTVFVGVFIFNATFCNSFRSLFRFLGYIQLRCYVLVLETPTKGFWISAWDLLLDALFFILVENQHVNAKKKK